MKKAIPRVTSEEKSSERRSLHGRIPSKGDVEDEEGTRT